LSSGRISRLDDCRRRFTFIEGSILEPPALDRALAGVEVVFHLAALVSVAKSIANPRPTNEVNVTGTIEVLRAASRHGVRRVVYAGSSAVYGMPERLPCSEDQPLSPMSPYGVSKLAGEQYVHALGRAWAVETAALRYFNVYGPGQDRTSEYAAVIPSFVSAVMGGARPTIFGTGEISRDFVYVADVVAATILAAQRSTPTALTCNIATGSETTLLQLLDEICVAVGRHVEPVYGPPRHGDIPASVGDISLARKALGYDVTVSLRDGIAMTVDSNLSGQG
jgi:UDP-glucose 4-epimerase